MGMNNWGGVTEHMTKKPRKVFDTKKLNYKNQDYLSKKLSLGETKLSQFAFKKMYLYLIYLGISLTLTLGICFCI